jgi:hypothetical protein
MVKIDSKGSIKVVHSLHIVNINILKHCWFVYVNNQRLILLRGKNDFQDGDFDNSFLFHWASFDVGKLLVECVDQ